MDKNAIKKFAIWARSELIERVTQKAQQYEVSINADPMADSAHGILLSKDEKRQREKLIAMVEEKGFDQVMEEVAYTWFNRLSALRFMEINNYLPSHVRVFTDAEGAFKPEILAEAIHLELDGLNLEKVYALKEGNKQEELFKYLIITQCNALSSVLPGMFQKISDYTELLFPDNLLREGSVIEKMVVQGKSDSIPEEDWNVTDGGQVEILGWLYQYYNDERRDQVVNIYQGAIKKEDVPAATQLFTTDWVVRYLVDNSLGRYWIERNPNSKLKNELAYYVIPKDGSISTIDDKVTPESLTILDPSMGSAHFGVYAFDVLMKIYTEYGYTERDAAASIVENNLFGLDIDDRAAQIAYFAIMMKALQYDKRFLKRGIQPHFYSIQESNCIDSHIIDYFANDTITLKKDISLLVDTFKDAKEFGSILRVPAVDFESLYARFEEIKSQENTSIYSQAVFEQLLPLVQVADIMSKKYVIVATNPPYMNKFDTKLKNYINENYRDYSGDLFSVFMVQNFNFCKNDGYTGFMTPFVWMFIKSYEKLRSLIINGHSISSLIQMEYSAFEEATVPICAFVLANKKTNQSGYYFRLSDFPGGMEVQKEKVLEALHNKECGYYYEVNDQEFLRIPSFPIAYWLSSNAFSAYDGKTLADYAVTKQGFKTGNNDAFLRMWFEVSIDRFSIFGGNKWFPCNKGGDFRRWYGNFAYTVDWENDGEKLINYRDEKGKQLSRPQNIQYNFREGITWTYISSSIISLRFSPDYMMFESAGPMCFPNNGISTYGILGYLNSCVAQYYLFALEPTIRYSEGTLLRLPFINVDDKNLIDDVKKCIRISKDEWDSYEFSWDFKRHPFINSKNSIKEAYEEWVDVCASRFRELKTCEEDINRRFIELYGLQNELTPAVADKNVGIRLADLRNNVCSFISYAVGCMFGRYSLDKDGVIFAGNNWDDSNYKTFPVDKDGIIPICDDEYFDDDITGLFIDFVKTVYGEVTLEDNLKFIATAIGGKGSPREIIRNYFMNDFYADHCATYSVTGSGKRPIYWLFDSGKKNGFKCLVYMHRYKPDTIARIRTDYVHEQQSRYRTAIAEIERQLSDATTSERVRLNKRLSTLKDQAEETRKYEEKIHHLADQMISIDLDDGVKHNYEIFKDVLAKIK